MAELNFKSRTHFPGLWKPTRGYLYEPGLYKAFSDRRDAAGYLREVVDGSHSILTPAQYIIAAVWVNGNNRMVELQGFSDTDPWHGNHDWRKYVFRDGLYQPDAPEVGCRHFGMILGRELEHVDRTTDLQDFMGNPPDLSEFGNIEEIYM